MIAYEKILKSDDSIPDGIVEYAMEFWPFDWIVEVAEGSLSTA